MLNSYGKIFRYPITHLFQPIYQLNNNDVFGYEALLRHSTSSEVSPISIFNEARKENCLNLLDLESIKLSCDFLNIDNTLLFVNIYPSTLLVKDFIDWWDKHIPVKSPIVLELLEAEPINDWTTTKSIVGELKQRGVEIAIDDLGAGNSFLKHWVELSPEYIKLDRYYSKNIATIESKRTIMKSLKTLFQESSKIIVEGIEEFDDLQVIRDLGITLAQGYLLGKPRKLKTNV